MTRASIHEINEALAEMERTANAEGSERRVTGHQKFWASSDAEAAAAFEADMAPICEAVATAIRAKDLAAFEGLKAMFGKLLAEAAAAPALAEILQRQIGEALIEGLTAKITKNAEEGGK